MNGEYGNSLCPSGACVFDADSGHEVMGFVGVNCLAPKLDVCEQERLCNDLNLMVLAMSEFKCTYTLMIGD